MLAARIGYAASAAYILAVYLKFSFFQFSIYSKNEYHWKLILMLWGFVKLIFGSVGSSKEQLSAHFVSTQLLLV